MNLPVDIAGILERAGADADAPAGSQAWALAAAATAVADLVAASRRLEQRGHFATSACADEATNADMALMRQALGGIQ